MPSSSPPPGPALPRGHGDGPAVVETIRRLARALDDRDWRAVRGCLDTELDTNYSSFRGTPPARLTADQFVELRRVGLAGLVTEHLTTHHDVALDGDGATCRCHFVIRRWPVDTTDPRFLHSDGTYTFALRHGPEGWRITSITQVVDRSEGDLRLHGAFRGGSASVPDEGERPDLRSRIR